MIHFCFSARYDIHCLGVERLHPFDSCKYGRAWAELRRIAGPIVERRLIRVDRAASDEELLLAHSPAYLARIKNSAEMAAALELPALRRLPAWLLRWRIAMPVRYAVRGTILAAMAAVEHGVAMNFSGGYHHAKPDHGEGFCLFSDIAAAVRHLRNEGLLASEQRVACVDLDAHQGNGVCHQFVADKEFFLFDMYNQQIYPWFDLESRGRIDCDLPLNRGCTGRVYLETLRARLPGFLDSVSRNRSIGLGIYNAGTDVLSGDPLGGLDLAAEDVLARDLFVVAEFRRRGIPVVMLPSGGYTETSYRLMAGAAARLLEMESNEH